MNTPGYIGPFIAPVRKLVKHHLRLIGCNVEGLHRNFDYDTDPVVLTTPDGLCVPCRVRRLSAWKNVPYRGEFTLRCSVRRDERQSELTRLLKGFGDYFFYGFGDDVHGQGEVLGWGLADLSVFRRIVRYVDLGHVREVRDGSAQFKVWRWAEFPGNIVVASAGIAIRKKMRSLPGLLD